MALTSWGLMILCGFISLSGLRAQPDPEDPASPGLVTIAGARFRIKGDPIAGKWFEAKDFSWECPGKIRLEAKQPIRVKWNVAQDSLFLDTIPGHRGECLAMTGTDFRFGGQFLVKEGYMTGTADFKTPGLHAASGNLSIDELGVRLSGSKLRFVALDSGSTMAEIVGGLEYNLHDPSRIVILPELSTFTKLCGGKWLSPQNEGSYDFKRHELSCADPRGLMVPLYVEDISSWNENAWKYRRASLRTARLSIFLDSGKVHASRISSLSIADALIKISNDSLSIDRRGNILDLKEAEISVDAGSSNHAFGSANVTFPTCSTYVARGFYQMLIAGGQEQRIPMQLHVQGDTMTAAHGEIEGPGFYLNEGFQYRGTLDVEGLHKEIHCKGIIQVDLRHPYFEGKWFPIDQTVDPEFVVLDVFGAAPTDSNVSCGVHWDSIWGPYPTFMGKKYSPQNQDLLRTWGSMAYDGTKRAFSIGSRELLQGKDLRGGVMHYTIDSTNVIAEGPMQFPSRFVPLLANLKCAGYLKEDASQHEISLNITGSIDLQALPKDAIRRITDKIRLVLAIEDGFDPRSPSMQIPLANLLDTDPEKKPNNYRKFVQASSNERTSYEINPGERLPFSTLLFSNFKPRWDAQMSSFWHSEKLAILSCAELGVNKFTVSNSKIEMRAVPASNGVPAHPELRMYIEFDDMNWIYLAFTPDGLSFASSDVDLMNELHTFKPRKNNKLTLLTEADKDQFLVNFVNTYIWRTGR